MVIGSFSEVNYYTHSPECQNYASFADPHSRVYTTYYSTGNIDESV